MNSFLPIFEKSTFIEGYYILNNATGAWGVYKESYGRSAIEIHWCHIPLLVVLLVSIADNLALRFWEKKMLQILFMGSQVVTMFMQTGEYSGTLKACWKIFISSRIPFAAGNLE